MQTEVKMITVSLLLLLINMKFDKTIRAEDMVNVG